MARDEIKRLLRSRKKYFTECQSRYAVITKEDEDRIYSFACSVVPRRWNIWTFAFGEPTRVRGILNIGLEIFASDCDRMGEADRCGVTYVGGVARTLIRIHPNKGDWPGTILHELAHIATDRRLSLINKPYLKNDFGFATSTMHGEDIHGPRFERALDLLINRMLNIYNYQYVYEYALLHHSAFLMSKKSD